MNEATFLKTTARSALSGCLIALIDTPTSWSPSTSPSATPTSPRYIFGIKLDLKSFGRFPRSQSIKEKSIDSSGQRRISKSGFLVGPWPPCWSESLVDSCGCPSCFAYPVHVAASVRTHHWYGPLPRGTISTDIQPDPFDPGVIEKHHSGRWQGLSPYEKLPFYWTEAHLYGVEVATLFPEVPFHRLRFEDILNSPAELIKDGEFPRHPVPEGVAE